MGYNDNLAEPQISGTSSDIMSRLENTITRIQQAPAELAGVFTETMFERARTCANAIGDRPLPLRGVQITIKDLFDVEGFVTRSGSRALDDASPADADAPAVKALISNGAIPLGHSNMTEFAYSGLGLNPHFGTPETPLKPGHIPGGSTSGGAVSVATGIADAALGSDTGGSLRIPAAFTGTVGFKPTQNTVSRHGARPLSQSLDSVGPIARNVDMCERVWRVLAGRADPFAKANANRLIVPTNFGLDDLDAVSAANFTEALKRLSDWGFDIAEQRLDMLDSYKSLPVWQFSAVESRATYASVVAERAQDLDPRVLSRMRRGETVSAIDYFNTCQARAALIEAFRRELAGAILVLPTTPITAPAFADLEDDAEYDRINLLCLRNTTLANVVDGCSISLPMSHAGEVTGVMLSAPGGTDTALLGTAKSAAAALQA